MRVVNAGSPSTGTPIWRTAMSIALISGLISRVSVRLVGRRYAAWFSTATAVRAAVMGSIAVWGGESGCITRGNVIE